MLERRAETELGLGHVRLPHQTRRTPQVLAELVPRSGEWSPACFDSREEAASIARHRGSQQIEFVEVVK